MSDNLLFALGISAFVFCFAGAVAFILAGILDGEREYRAASQESYVEASLRPSTGLVAVSTQDPPYDREMEAEIQQAQAFVWALHRIEAASSEERWDWALGQGRN